MVIIMYFHGVINGMVDKKVLDILTTREIKASKKMNSNKMISFNGDEHVSICTYLGDEVYAKYPNNAFYKYIMNHFCFIIRDNIVVEKPIFIEDMCGMNSLEIFNLQKNNPDKRFSDIIDELQVKGNIPFANVMGIGIPYNLEMINGFIKLSDFCFLTKEEFLNFIKEVEKLASDLGLIIYDSSSPLFIDSLTNSCTEKMSRLN